MGQKPLTKKQATGWEMCVYSFIVQCFNLTEIQDQQEHCTPGYYIC